MIYLNYMVDIDKRTVNVPGTILMFQYISKNKMGARKMRERMRRQMVAHRWMTARESTKISICACVQILIVNGGEWYCLLRGLLRNS